MRFIRKALIVGGLHFCFLFLFPGNSYSQVPTPPPYVFVEVKDTAGQKVTDATVVVTSQTGNPVVRANTNQNGIAKTELGVRSSDHHYNVIVSKSGYLNSEDVFFLSPCCHPLGSALTRRILDEDGVLKYTSKFLPAEVVLTKIPLSSEEDRKYQFFLAIKRGDKDTVDKLLRTGTNANTVDTDKIPAITWAVFAGNGEIIKSLLDAGADIRDTKSITNQSLLIYLIEGIPRNQNNVNNSLAAQHDEIVRKLIKADAAINIKSWHGETVLSTAIRLAHWSLSPETINLLISSGADLKTVDISGGTPLMVAISTNSPEIVTMLVKGGSPVNAKDANGFTALMHVVAYPGLGVPIVKLFLESGADPNIKNNFGETALEYARKLHAGKDVISLLEEAGRKP